jgi:hypothetical protein
MRTALRSLTFVALFIGSAMLPHASEPASVDEEIDFLIGSVGTDGCSLIRNGEKYSTRAARQHLRSKRRRNAHLIDSTESFIHKIASRSATSGDPYLISCRGKPEQNAADWFTAQLAARRSLR